MNIFDAAWLKSKQSLKWMGRSVGLEIRRQHKADAYAERRARWIERLGIQTVFDIGANRGQYGKALRTSGFAGRIVSVEPLPQAHAVLRQTAEAHGPWTVTAPEALGNVPGQRTLYVTENDVSSSLLRPVHHPATHQHEAFMVQELEVPVTTLSALRTEHLPSHEIAWLKIDTQGGERDVLAGESQLEAWAAVELELSLRVLYEGQALALDVLNVLAAQGFRLVDLSPEFLDTQTGELLQVNALHVRDAGIRRAASS